MAKEVSRRDFLKLAGGLAGGLALTRFLPERGVAASRKVESGDVCGYRFTELGIGAPTGAEILPLATDPDMGRGVMSTVNGLIQGYCAQNKIDMKDFSAQSLSVFGDGKEFMGQKATRTKLSVPMIRIMAGGSDGDQRVGIFVKRNDGKGGVALDAPTKKDLTDSTASFVVFPMQRVEEPKADARAMRGPANILMSANGTSRRVASEMVGLGWSMDLAMFNIPSGMNNLMPVDGANSNPFFLK